MLLPFIEAGQPEERPSTAPQDATTGHDKEGTWGVLPDIKHFLYIWATAPFKPHWEARNLLLKKHESKDPQDTKSCALCKFCTCTVQLQDDGLQTAQIIFHLLRDSYAWLRWLPLLRSSIISDLAPPWKVTCVHCVAAPVQPWKRLLLKTIMVSWPWTPPPHCKIQMRHNLAVTKIACLPETTNKSAFVSCFNHTPESGE